MTFLIIVTTHPFPAFQVIVSPVPYVKFSRKKFFTFIRVSAPRMVSLGALRTPAPTPYPAIDATDLHNW